MKDSDLIRRGDVLNLAKNLVFTNDKGEPVFRHICVNLESVRSVPAVDAVEVAHGIWIKEDYTFYRCSVCDQRISIVGNPTNYCPNCGARMDGRREEGDDGEHQPDTKR